MDLICPSCLKRQAVAEHQAGLPVTCDACGKPFQAPALFQPPSTFAVQGVESIPFAAPLPAAPAPRPEPLPVAEPVPAVPAPASAPAAAAVTSPPDIPQPLPVLPASWPLRQDAVPEPGPVPAPAVAPVASPEPAAMEYDHTLTFRLRPDLVAWAPPVCITLIFFLSFFTWHYQFGGRSLNLWQLAFTDKGRAYFTLYVVLTILLAWPLSVCIFVLQRKWLPMPPGLGQWLLWRFWPMAILLLASFVAWTIDYVACQFDDLGNPIMVPMKLAYRLHLLALLGCVGEWWLERRKSKNLPLPNVRIRW